jgi:structural maintenance of chromosome 2
MQIMNMKPHEILSLLEEASGTKLYERKKDSAMKTLSKKQTKLDEIDEVRCLAACQAVAAAHCMYLACSNKDAAACQADATAHHQRQALVCDSACTGAAKA